MPLSEILSLYYLLTLYLLHIAFSFRTCGFPKLCPRAEFSWLENALILFRVLPNPSLLKRGTEMHYSTTHGWIPSAYCTQTHHEFSRAPYASERGNCKCMNQGIERNIKQADRGLKNKETERIRACLRSCCRCGGFVAGRDGKKTPLPFKFIFTLFSASPWWAPDRSLQSPQGRLRLLVILHLNWCGTGRGEDKKVIRSTMLFFLLRGKQLHLQTLSGTLYALKNILS